MTVTNYGCNLRSSEEADIDQCSAGMGDQSFDYDVDNHYAKYGDRYTMLYRDGAPVSTDMSLHAGPGSGDDGAGEGGEGGEIDSGEGDEDVSSSSNGSRIHLLKNVSDGSISESCSSNDSLDTSSGDSSNDSSDSNSGDSSNDSSESLSGDSSNDSSDTGSDDSSSGSSMDTSSDSSLELNSFENQVHADAESMDVDKVIDRDSAVVIDRADAGDSSDREGSKALFYVNMNKDNTPEHELEMMVYHNYLVVNEFNRINSINKEYAFSKRRGRPPLKRRNKT